MVNMGGDATCARVEVERRAHPPTTADTETQIIHFMKCLCRVTLGLSPRFLTPCKEFGFRWLGVGLGVAGGVDGVRVLLDDRVMVENRTWHGSTTDVGREEPKNAIKVRTVRIQGQAIHPKGFARHLVDTQRFKSKPMAMPAASTMKNTVGD
jgi:hypothetical protein